MSLLTLFFCKEKHQKQTTSKNWSPKLHHHHLLLQSHKLVLKRLQQKATKCLLNMLLQCPLN